jgi:hypothetical protein
MIDPEETLEPDSVCVRLIRMILAMTDEQQLALYKQLDQSSAQSASERDDIRLPYAQTVHFILKEHSYTGISEDISSSGMFIEVPGTFQVGQTIIATIPFSNDHSHLKIPAEVVRVTGQGIGIRFMKKLES